MVKQKASTASSPQRRTLSLDLFASELLAVQPALSPALLAGPVFHEGQNGIAKFLLARLKHDALRSHISDNLVYWCHSVKLKLTVQLQQCCREEG